MHAATLLVCQGGGRRRKEEEGGGGVLYCTVEYMRVNGIQGPILLFDIGPDSPDSPDSIVCSPPRPLDNAWACHVEHIACLCDTSFKHLLIHQAHLEPRLNHHCIPSGLKKVEQVS